MLQPSSVGDLEVPWQPARRDHALLEVLGEGLLVGLDPDQVLGVVHQLRGRRHVGRPLATSTPSGGVEPDERDRRAPEVLYDP